MSTIIGSSLSNLPWEDKPKGCIEPMWRYSNNPVTGWDPTPSTARVFNSAVLPHEGEFVGVFRADHKIITANLHFGRSKDGFNFEFDDNVIPWVDEQGNPAPSNYAYDPRFLKIDGSFYVIWCDDMHGPSIGLGYTKDLKNWIRLPNPLMPFNRNGVLFPRKVNGMYKMLSRPSDSGHTPFGDIFISDSPDLRYWGNHKWVMGSGGKGWWQSLKIGAGPPPIETTEGWLLFYHGVVNTCNGYVYSIGAAILDIDEPSRVLYRCGNYLLTPQRDYEVSGFVPNVAFPCQNLYDAPTGRIAIYYGAADTYTAIAFCHVDEVIDYVKKHHEEF